MCGSWWCVQKKKRVYYGGGEGRRRGGGGGGEKGLFTNAIHGMDFWVQMDSYTPTIYFPFSLHLFPW